MSSGQRYSLFAAIACAFCFGGCSQTSSLLNLKKVPKATAKDPVFEILGLWEPAEGRGPDGKPRRGCAGQILFITRGQKSPVRIDGDVVIQQFDDVGTPEEQTKPLHTFRFDNGSWNNHFGDGSMGPSYSVFIPYMRDSEYKTVCALRIQYTSADGQKVQSAIARINLPGAERKPFADQSKSTPESVSAEPTPTVKNKLMTQRLATLDGTGLRPVREKSTGANRAARNSVQHATWTTESTDDRHAKLDDLKTRKIAELEEKLAEMRNEAKQKTSSKSGRFQTASATRSRFRMSGRQMTVNSDQARDDE